MLEEPIRDVLYNVPNYREKATPFILLPEVHGLLEINRT
jgi:hypothetical protein